MDRAFPNPRADEIGMLTGCLDWQRATVRLKAEGLNDHDAYRELLATSPKMTIAGVVSHLRWTEWDGSRGVSPRSLVQHWCRRLTNPVGMRWTGRHSNGLSVTMSSSAICRARS